MRRNHHRIAARDDPIFLQACDDSRGAIVAVATMMDWILTRDCLYTVKLSDNRCAVVDRTAETWVLFLGSLATQTLDSQATAFLTTQFSPETALKVFSAVLRQGGYLNA